MSSQSIRLQPFRPPIHKPSPLPLKHKPGYPWGFDMTLCIAAACRTDELLGDERVVVGFDWRVETQTASAETCFKFDILSERWAVLVAGPLHQARELSRNYGAFLKEHERSLNSNNVLECLRGPMRDFRKGLADTYTHSTVAMSYDNFLNNGATCLPEDLHRQIAYAISAQRVDVELILVGQVDGSFVIAKCIDGQIEQCDDFAVVGSGTLVAEAALYQRGQRHALGLANTIYNVFEAQRLGQIAPGVGIENSLSVLYADHSSIFFDFIDTPSDRRFLDKQFQRFGPRKVKDIGLPPGFAEETKTHRTKHNLTSRGRSLPESSTHDPSPLPPSPE